MFPFAIAAIGVLLDALTTIVGLSIGLHEINSHYNPVFALLIFWSLIAISRLLPQTRSVRFFAFLLSVAPFVGFVNNSLVITGALSGLAI
jgi:hypothetical protein